MSNRLERVVTINFPTNYKSTYKTFFLFHFHSNALEDSVQYFLKKQQKLAQINRCSSVDVLLRKNGLQNDCHASCNTEKRMELSEHECIEMVHED